MSKIKNFVVSVIIVTIIVVILEPFLLKRWDTDHGIRTMDSHSRSKKILFDQLNYLDLLAWFEIHRSLGVNKVLGYVADNLNEKARIVLGHYQRTGLFEALHSPMETESKGSLYAAANIGTKALSYRGVSVNDGQIRLGGYEYVISFDPDEMLIPTDPKESFRDVLGRLLSKQQNAAGFTFKTHFFMKDWGAEGNSSYLVERYRTRSTDTRDCVKLVAVPNRVRKRACGS